REARPAVPLAGLLVALALGLRSRAHAAGAVHGRIEGFTRHLAVDAFEDDRVVAHRATDEAALSRECRGRALADDPVVAIAVPFTPREVVVVVNRVDHLGAQHAPDGLDHPFPARIGIAAGEPHGGEVARA